MEIISTVVALLFCVSIVFIFMVFVGHILCKRQFSKGYLKGLDEAKKIYEATREYRRETLFSVGNKVIVIPNEWSDPLVGFIEGFLETKNGPSDVPVVKDLLTDKLYNAFGLVIPYSPEILEALLKLDPFERYSLATSQTSASANDYVFGKQKRYLGSQTHRPSQLAEDLRAKVKSLNLV